MVPIVLCGCQTWSLTLRKEHRLRVMVNRVLRKLFMPEIKKVRGNRRRIIMRSFMNCIPLTRSCSEE